MNPSPTNRRLRLCVISYILHHGAFTVSLWGTIFYKSGRSGPNTRVFRTSIYGTTRPYIVVRVPRARMRARARKGRDGMGFVCRRRARRRTERPTDRDDRDRSHRTRLSRHSLSRVVIDRFERRIHSFIHSRATIRCERTNERRDERTNEETFSRETLSRRDDRRIRTRRASRGAHVSNANASNASNRITHHSF